MPVNLQAHSNSIIIMSSPFSAPPQPEPILTDNAQRFVLFPIQYHSIYEMYKKHLASFWTAD